MKSLIFSLLALVGLLLVALQHQQLGHLRAENVALAQASAEAGQLKADLAKSTGDEAQDADEIARLREENRDLLKLRNEVNQLRDARAEFQKVSAENQRLQLAAKNMPKPDAKETSFRPIVIRVDNLFNRGWSKPEAAVQTLFWAERNGDMDTLSRCIVPERWAGVREKFRGGSGKNFSGIVSIEIVARRQLDANTVQIGVQLHTNNDPRSGRKIIFTLNLRGGEWKVSMDSL